MRKKKRKDRGEGGEGGGGRGGRKVKGSFEPSVCVVPTHLSAQLCLLAVVCAHACTDCCTLLEEGDMFMGSESDHPFTSSVATPELESPLHWSQTSKK